MSPLIYFLLLFNFIFSANATEKVEDFFPSHHVTLPFDNSKKITNPASLLLKANEISIVLKRYNQEGGYQIAGKDVVELEDSSYFWVRAAFLSPHFAVDLSSELGRENKYKEAINQNIGNYQRENSNFRLNLAYPILPYFHLGFAYETKKSVLERNNIARSPNNFSATTEEEKSLKQFELASLFTGLAPFYPSFKITRLSTTESYTESGDFNRYSLGLGHVSAFSGGAFRADIVFSYNGELIKTGQDSPLFIPKESLLSLQAELNYPFAPIDQSIMILGFNYEKGSRAPLRDQGDKTELSSIAPSIGLRFNSNYIGTISLEKSKVSTGSVENNYKRIGLSIGYSI